MNSLIRKIKVINNRGAINMGNCYNLSPFFATKAFSGAGGSSFATFLNGKLMPPSVPTGTEFTPPLETSLTAGA
ncbi:MULTISPECIES: spore germination protein [unclassified Bacillus (in: firmicutes)]|uniref:spore germination protein n=1 Tax=unclassified Bacillus (in: firmicutes) TaxID=185979 RepID=UPI000B875F94|nr:MULTISPECIES: spore germination protein [unclassified Bacillus (in: firmicutes)]